MIKIDEHSYNLDCAVLYTVSELMKKLYSSYYLKSAPSPETEKLFYKLTDFIKSKFEANELEIEQIPNENKAYICLEITRVLSRSCYTYNLTPNSQITLFKRFKPSLNKRFTANRKR